MVVKITITRSLLSKEIRVEIPIHFLSFIRFHSFSFQDGERMYKLIGNIPEKDMAMLEERIKRLSKNRPAPGSEMPPPPAPAPQSRLPSADMRNGHPPNPRAASAEKRGQTPTAPMGQRQPSQPRQQLVS